METEPHTRPHGKPRGRIRFDPKSRLARCDRKIAGYLRQIDRIRECIDDVAEERMRLLLSLRTTRAAPGGFTPEAPHG